MVRGVVGRGVWQGGRYMESRVGGEIDDVIILVNVLYFWEKGDGKRWCNERWHGNIGEVAMQGIGDCKIGKIECRKGSTRVW